jgi:hypothetical protein
MPLWVMGSEEFQEEVYILLSGKDIYDLVREKNNQNCTVLYEEDNWDDRYLKDAFISSSEEIIKFFSKEEEAAIVFGGWSIFDPFETELVIIKSRNTRESVRIILKEIAWRVHEYLWDVTLVTFSLPALLEREEHLQDILRDQDIAIETEHPDIIVLKMDNLMSKLIEILEEFLITS